MENSLQIFLIKTMFGFKEKYLTQFISPPLLDSTFWDKICFIIFIMSCCHIWFIRLSRKMIYLSLAIFWNIWEKKLLKEVPFMQRLLVQFWKFLVILLKNLKVWLLALKIGQSVLKFLLNQSFQIYYLGTHKKMFKDKFRWLNHVLINGENTSKLTFKKLCTKPFRNSKTLIGKILPLLFWLLLSYLKLFMKILQAS